MPTHSTAGIIAALRAEGIDCEAHQLGLAAHCRDPREYAQALKACQPTTLRVLTMQGNQGIDLTTPPCSGSMLCDCPSCEAERAAAIKRGPSRVRQPWEARAA